VDVMGKSVTVATTAPAADPVALATPLATLSALKVDKSMPCNVRGMTTAAATGDGGVGGGSGGGEAGLGLGDGDGMGLGGGGMLGLGDGDGMGLGDGGIGGLKELGEGACIG